MVARKRALRTVLASKTNSPVQLSANVMHGAVIALVSRKVNSWTKARKKIIVIFDFFSC